MFKLFGQRLLATFFGGGWCSCGIIESESLSEYPSWSIIIHISQPCTSARLLLMLGLGKRIIIEHVNFSNHPNHFKKEATTTNQWVHYMNLFLWLLGGDQKSPKKKHITTPEFLLCFLCFHLAVTLKGNLNPYPPGNHSISHLGKRKIIDSKVSLVEDVWWFPGG